MTGVPVPENFDFGDFDEVAQSTNNPDIDEFDSFFQHFPAGGGGGVDNEGSDIRNPLNVCQTILEKCP